MKEVAFIVHIPMIIVGAIAGTLVYGFIFAYKETLEWWDL